MVDDIYALIGERIRTARERRGWSQEQLGQQVPVDGATISRYEAGKQRPDLNMLLRISQVLGKPLEFFLDPKYLPPSPDDVVAIFRERVGDILAIRWVPVSSAEVPAGPPAQPSEDIEGWSVVPEEMGVDMIVKVRGDSMIEAGINPGDYVYVRRADSARRGQKVIVRIGDEVVCKRYDVDENGMVWLRSCNRQMPDIPLHGDEDAAILGVVVAVTRVEEGETFVSKRLIY